MSGPFDGMKIIDVDTHVIEPPDLWTRRMSKRWGDLTPHVKWDEQYQDEAWCIDGKRIGLAAGAGAPAMAGWNGFPPKDTPKRWSDVAVTAWDAKPRLKLMDEYGVHAHFLYPNVALFNSDQLRQADRAFSLELVSVYNDWQTEWSEADPKRLYPVTLLPFWDLEATLKEIRRCRDMGHRGVVFTQEPNMFGQPVLTSRHWEPLWATAEELGMPITFHQATGDTSSLKTMDLHAPHIGLQATYTAIGTEYPLGNAETISWLICSGICHRHPKLKFLSLESGVGWLPFVLEALDWTWKGVGVAKEHPEYDLLPSEYFARQIYGAFWFERASAREVITRMPDNILYQTDFPHPTCMAPGPASPGQKPIDYLEENFSDIPRDVMKKILQDNASQVYNLD